MKHRSHPAAFPRAARFAGCALLLLCAVSSTFAADSPSAIMETPMLDPWVALQARKPSTVPPPQGAALRVEVERKLKQGFDAADVRRQGAITREQARAAGLGYIAQHFDEIDRARTGSVRFDDVKHYLRERGAQFD